MDIVILQGEPVVNAKIKHVEINGRQFIVAPITIYRPGVLVGSNGALYYPPEEIKQVVEQWNGKPLVVYHPKSGSRNVSANSPEIFAKQQIGTFYNSSLDKNHGNKGEGWFDVELTKKIDNRIYQALIEGKKIEVSTGLYTDNDEAPKGSNDKGTEYTHIARRYRPDHVAILPDEIGACSIKDGCGVHNKSQSKNDSTEEQKTDEKLVYPSACPHCRTPLEIDPDSGKCNRCGRCFWGWCCGYGINHLINK